MLAKRSHYQLQPGPGQQISSPGGLSSSTSFKAWSCILFVGPALLIVVCMFRLGLFLPDLFTNPKIVFDPDLSLVDIEIEEGRLPYGMAIWGGTLLSPFCCIHHRAHPASQAGC
jgi:hypothetical protein